jgi:hypothetical protein
VCTSGKNSNGEWVHHPQYGYGGRAKRRKGTRLICAHLRPLWVSQALVAYNPDFSSADFADLRRLPKFCQVGPARQFLAHGHEGADDAVAVGFNGPFGTEICWTWQPGVETAGLWSNRPSGTKTGLWLRRTEAVKQAVRQVGKRFSEPGS